MNKLLASAALVAASLVAPLSAFAADAPPVVPIAKPAVEDKPRIDVVFAIDCSGSMGGVIETAKQKVWAIVNEVARAKPAPELRIGLIAYGNAMGPFRAYPLSSDLDEVYKNLLTFKDEGWGDEYVGLAVHRATTDMKWADGKQVYKVIYVVGNETARQGPAEFDYAKTAPGAIAKGIVVNAIYCGNTDHASATPTWREIAKLADGSYMEIAGQGGAVVVASPFDKELTDLSGKLNTTYVGYGRQREEKAAAQVANDATSGGFSAASAADRAVSKSSRQYDNAHWDLVDAQRNKDFDITKLKDEELPEEMRKMTPDQRKAHVDAKARERADIAKQIQDISAKRDAYVKEEVSKKGLDTNKAFDEAVRRSINEQAAKRGFQFEGTEAPKK
ncbi:MAG TPA: vWA domain-containing protein [Tepidisphaeraceae bacterium]|nr:vWA domain-containing protein [Tepidisphaeraceae bacterium]